MGITFLNSPMGSVFQAFEELYPDKDCLFEFVPQIEGGGYGVTIFPDDGSTTVIFVDINLSYLDMLDIITHELAHLVVGVVGGDGHGEEWGKVYGFILDKYEEIEKKRVFG